MSLEDGVHVPCWSVFSVCWSVDVTRRAERQRAHNHVRRDVQPFNARTEELLNAAANVGEVGGRCGAASARVLQRVPKQL